MIYVFICNISALCAACFECIPCTSLFQWQHAICHLPVIHHPVSVTVNLYYCMLIIISSLFSFFHSLLPLSFSFALFLFSVLLTDVIFLTLFIPLSNLSHHPFILLLLSCFSTFFLSSPVSISPPGAGPQLCGVPVLLPTWAERLFPPGPLPGANDRAVPGQRQPMPHIQPQQQVGRTTTARNNDNESRWTHSASWFQKFWAAVVTVCALNAATTLFRFVVEHAAVREQGLRQSETGFEVRLSINFGTTAERGVLHSSNALSSFLFPSKCVSVLESEHFD